MFSVLLFLVVLDLFSALYQTPVISVHCDKSSGSQKPIYSKNLPEIWDILNAMAPTISSYSSSQILTDREAVGGTIPMNSTLAGNNKCDRACTIIVPTVILSIVLLFVLIYSYSYWRSRGQGPKKSTDQATPWLPRFPKLHYRGLFSGCISRERKDRQEAVIAGNEMRDVVGVRRFGSLRKGPRQSGYVDIEEGAAVVMEARTLGENKTDFEAPRPDSGRGNVPPIPSKYPRQ